MTMATMAAAPKRSLPKSPTGIAGLDDITGGGIPTGRPTLLCGQAGCGKTLLAMEFLVRGAVDYGEPGVFVAFEETAPELTANVRSLGFDLAGLISRKKLLIDHVRVERHEIEETGEYDLEALFIRLRHAVSSIGAKRIVLDTLESLFGALPNQMILRSELRRLFGWLKQEGLTAIITAERGDGALTRHGIEEYVSDCVIVLDHRVSAEISTRRLHILKYRGSTHGTNEYPFLIDESGITVLPITGAGLRHLARATRVPTGVPRLDAMLGGGYYEGSTVLISGTAGSGKTSMAAHFARASCQRGRRCLWFLFEESPDQVMRNMRSIGIDLRSWVRKGRLAFHAARPSAWGLEMHLVTMHRAIDGFDPHDVVIDPISAFIGSGDSADAVSMLVRLVDMLKGRGTTSVLTDLTHGSAKVEHSSAQISSLVDTWLLLRDVELNAERNRVMYVLKSRGMAHSNQMREFRLTGRGIELEDVYVGASGVATGSSRLTQEARDLAERVAGEDEADRQRQAMRRRREALDNRIAALRAEFAAEQTEALAVVDRVDRRASRVAADRVAMAASRHADSRAKQRGKRERAS